VDLINSQESDVILFTGDLVNNQSKEMEPWMDTFKKLKAPMGKYSILGKPRLRRLHHLAKSGSQKSQYGKPVCDPKATRV